MRWIKREHQCDQFSIKYVRDILSTSTKVYCSYKTRNDYYILNTHYIVYYLTELQKIWFHCESRDAFWPQSTNIPASQLDLPAIKGLLNWNTGITCTHRESMRIAPRTSSRIYRNPVTYPRVQPPRLVRLFSVWRSIRMITTQPL